MTVDDKKKPVRKPARLQLDEYLPFRLSVASNEVSLAIARAYESRFGLSIPEWRLIAVLAEQELTQRAMIARTMMDKVTVSRAARSLVDRGIVARTAHAVDGRSHTLALTTEGWHLHGEIAPLALNYEAALLSNLSTNEVKALKRLLRRLEDAAAERLQNPSAETGVRRK